MLSYRRESARYVSHWRQVARREARRGIVTAAAPDDRDASPRSAAMIYIDTAYIASPFCVRLRCADVDVDEVVGPHCPPCVCRACATTLSLIPMSMIVRLREFSRTHLDAWREQQYRRGEVLYSAANDLLNDFAADHPKIRCRNLRSRPAALGIQAVCAVAMWFRGRAVRDFRAATGALQLIQLATHIQALQRADPFAVAPLWSADGPDVSAEGIIRRLRRLPRRLSAALFCLNILFAILSILGVCSALPNTTLRAPAA